MTTCHCLALTTSFSADSLSAMPLAGKSRDAFPEKEVTEDNMPNWCENILTITGGARDIERWKDLAQPQEDQEDSALSLARLYPMPEGIGQGDVGPEEAQHDGHNTWYYWCIEHWGTKWDVQATLMDIAPGLLAYRFESAWSPPVPWLAKVAHDFPSLRFVLRYDEPLMGFAGVAIAEQGALIVDACTEYA